MQNVGSEILQSKTSPSTKSLIGFLLLVLLGMSRHQYDLVQCMKQPGRAVGLVCQQCEDRCPICDSYVKATTKVRICESCNFGHLGNKCILCTNFLGNNNENGVPAYYCLECVRMEKDREGCPRILNVGSLKSDLIFKKKSEK